ncbi:hypothetical protein GQ651_04160 [Alphaproteobacteria bacterium GH1-50]|uniref:Uncharacterized protein n=1 Tax=Kangsaoukella pontilimi TaxID=2691042 RepID=A0A7C9MEH5_9RHOB|nr:hypothetical protein [Kangsaoukella pontilimi]MXQ07036.1 hypothetical protein [Kangsaoukella pontilimi]
MIERALPSIWQERRRLAFVGILAFLAGFFFYARSDMVVYGLPAGVVTGAVYASVIVPVSLAVCIFAPSIRFLIEAVAVSRFLISLVVFAFPDLGAVILGMPLLTAMLVVSLGAILSRTVLHGRIVKRRPGSFLKRVKAFFTRMPARLHQPTAFQSRFVSWVDATDPVTVRA